MRTLVIDSDVKRRIAELKQYAEANRIPYSETPRAAAGDNPNHVMMIPIGFVVVYSIEECPVYGGIKRLSIAIQSDDLEAMPSVPAADIILQQFGMCDGVHQVDVVALERPSPDIHVVVFNQLENRHLAEVEETDGRIPSKDTREQKLRELGLLYRTLHEQ